MSFTRRRFLQTTGLLLAAPLAAKASPFVASRKLSFSTLGCPDWPFEKIVEFAAANQYNGLELRGILRQMDLPLCPEFTDKKALKHTLKLMRKNGLQFVNLGSSAAMHHNDAAEIKKSTDEAKRFIDLAEKLHCPFIRIFPNNLPKNEAKEITLQRISEGFHQLAEYASGKNVTVLMETHGDLVHADDIVNVMQQVNHSNAALIWDATNMWSVTKEPVSGVCEKLYPWIKHTHVKDAKMVDGKPQYTLLGDGEIPMFEAIACLEKKGYKGYYSFEWEKLWHPELMEPDIPLADFAKKMRAV